MLAICFIRCLLTTAAVRLILINIQVSTSATELLTLKDFLLRLAPFEIEC